jgi:uncharacterized membrane protein
VPGSLLVVTMLLNIAADFADRRSARGASAYEMSLWGAILQLFLILPFIGLVESAGMTQIILCVAVGIVSALGRIPWYRALASHQEQLSKLTPFLRLSSVFVLLLSYLKLGESFTQSKAIGASFIILGAIFITMDRPRYALRMLFRKGGAAWSVTLFSISTAFIAVLYKFSLTGGMAVWTVYFYLKASQAAVLVIVILGIMGKSRAPSFLEANDIRLFTFARVLQTIAALIYLLVLRNLELSSVEPIMALSPFIYLLIETCHARFWPADVALQGPIRQDAVWRPTRLHIAALCIVAVGALVMSMRRNFL